jgi:subtilisin family serine protease
MEVSVSHLTTRIVRFAALASTMALLPLAANASSSVADASTGRASFVVSLAPGVDVAAVAREWRGRGAPVPHVYQHAMRGFAADLTPAQVSSLRSDPRVSTVEPDGVVQASSTQDGATWGLDRVDQRNLPLNKTYTYDTTASSVTVYVIDTGVRATHQDLAGRVALGYTSINDGRGTDDCNGHGTHVAGTVASTVHGVAKGVSIVPVRVLDCNGSGTWSGVIAGVDWITSRHTTGTPAVANMSLGGGASASLDKAVRNSVAKGVVYSVAAGNDNKDACNYSPARVAEALTVASTTSSDARSSFSNFGTCVQLFAPGSSITSSWNSSDTSTRTLNGTSMAAPHVAGVAALYLSARPTATPAEVRDAVLSGATTGVVSGANGSPNLLAYSKITPSDGSGGSGGSDGSGGDETQSTAPATPAAPLSSANPRRSITVSWTAPSDGGSSITHYEVRIHQASNGAVVKSGSVSGSTTSTTIGGLTAGTSYYSTVRATNEVGPSGWSPNSNSVSAIR